MRLTSAICPECSGTLRIDLHRDLQSFACPYCGTGLQPAKRGFALHLVQMTSSPPDFLSIADALIQIAEQCADPVKAKEYYRMALTLHQDARTEQALVRMELAEFFAGTALRPDGMMSLFELDPHISGFSGILKRGCDCAEEPGKFVYDLFRQYADVWVEGVMVRYRGRAHNGFLRGESWVQKTVGNKFDDGQSGWLYLCAEWMEKMGTTVWWNGMRALVDGLILRLPKRISELQLFQAKLFDPRRAGDTFEIVIPESAPVEGEVS